MTDQRKQQRAEYMKQWSANNKEKRRDYSLEFYHRNREDLLKKRRSRSNTPEGKARRAEYNRRYNEKNPSQKRDLSLKKRYGISLDDFNALVRSQGECCALCLEPLGDDMVIDHDHKTQRIRGVLHNNCNTGIGLFREDPKRLECALRYVRENCVVGLTE